MIVRQGRNACTKAVELHVEQYDKWGEPGDDFPCSNRRSMKAARYPFACMGVDFVHPRQLFLYAGAVLCKPQQEAVGENWQYAGLIGVSLLQCPQSAN